MTDDVPTEVLDRIVAAAQTAEAQPYSMDHYEVLAAEYGSRMAAELLRLRAAAQPERGELDTALTAGEQLCRRCGTPIERHTECAQLLQHQLDASTAERGALRTQIDGLVDVYSTECDRLRAELTDAHLRLDETRAAGTKGQPLRQRINWLIELLTHESQEKTHIIAASGHEMDALRSQASAAAHRAAEAARRAQRVVMVEKLDKREKELRAEVERLTTELNEVKCDDVERLQANQAELTAECDRLREANRRLEEAMQAALGASCNERWCAGGWHETFRELLRKGD